MLLLPQDTQAHTQHTQGWQPLFSGLVRTNLSRNGSKGAQFVNTTSTFLQKNKACYNL